MRGSENEACGTSGQNILDKVFTALKMKFVGQVAKWTLKNLYGYS